jgi:hypothetical protein
MSEQTNQKRELVELLQKARILMGIPIILLAASLLCAIGWMIAFTGTRNVTAGVIAMLLGVVVLIWGLYTTIKSFTTTSKVVNSSPKLNPFNVANDVTRASGGIATQLADGEHVVAWAGPISFRSGGPSIEYPTAKETNTYYSVNTMIITDRQIIFVLLGYDDLPEGSSDPYVEFSEHVPGSEVNKASQFLFLHQNQWPLMIDKLLQGDLPQIVASHYNYSFPYSSVVSAEARRHELLNHCIDFEMVDGSTNSITIMTKSQRTPVLESLRPYIHQIDINES